MGQDDTKKQDISASLLSVKISNFKKRDYEFLNKGEYLSSLASDCLNVIEDDKSKLISTASWWGTQFWARYGLRNLSKEERLLRLSLLEAARILKYRLRKCENDFSHPDEMKAFVAANDLLIWGKVYNRIFLENFAKIMEINTVKPIELIDETGKKEKKIPDSEKNLFENFKTFKNLFDNYSQMDQVSLYVKDSGNLTAEEQKRYEKAEERLHEAVILANGILDKSKKEQFILNEESNLELINKIKKHHDGILRALIIASKGEFGEPDTLIELAQKMGIQEWASEKTEKEKKELAKKEKEIKEARRKEAELLEKVAHNVITRWVRRKLLSLNKDIVKQLRLKIVENIKSATDMLDDIMNILKDSKKSTSDIINTTQTFNKLLLNIYSDLSEYISVYYRQQDKQYLKEKGEPIVSRPDRNEFDKDIKKIMGNIFSYTGQDE